MLNNLNVNSRRVILSLCKGETAKLGKEVIKAIDVPSRHLLGIISININTLGDLTGGGLVDQFDHLFSDFDLDKVFGAIEASGDSQNGRQRKGLKLAKIKAFSFRGLAPAERVWGYDLEEMSHLIYGPNGSGKSSLFGAICWCLTGKLFRDDCPPHEPEKIKAFSISSTGNIERDDAHALIDGNGNSSSSEKSYWVKISLVGKDSDGESETIHLLRDSKDGLSWSQDNNKWLQIEGISEAGIDDLDAELRLLMPAQVAHMKLGKNPDLIRLLADITGYGDFERITETAEKLVTGAKRKANDIEKKELRPEQEAIQIAVTQIGELANNFVKELPSYQRICGDDRTKEEVREFGNAINQKIEDAKVQLAGDLGLDIPDKTSAEYKEWQKKSDNLPGQISNLLSEFDKPLSELFKCSIGLKLPSEEELKNIEQELRAFEKKALKDIAERLDFAKREKENAKTGLMLKAAAFFPEGSKFCPVCEQLLDKVPGIKKELDEFKAISSKEHLQKKLEDFERSLKADLDKIVTSNNRSKGVKSFAKWILEDWDDFKSTQCKELLLAIAERYNDQIKSLTNGIQQTAISSFKLPIEYESEFANFSSFGQELDRAKNFIELCKCSQSNMEEVSKTIINIIIQSDEGSSFKEILERARENNKTLKQLISIQAEARKLWTSVGKIELIKQKIKKFTEFAESAEPIKQMKRTVREEVKRMVSGGLGKKTQEYYEKLYSNEVLPFQQLTPGHAANPDIKTEINLYLKAGEHQVPMGPYSNAGRMRALLLSFVFALLDKSSRSLDFIVLDDPALSLDDEHKRRFVDHLVEPQVKNGQVVLGTHYESFFKDSEHIFAKSKSLRMIPRRIAKDEVLFEAGDLLLRVEKALGEQSDNWSEVGGNLRIWIERILATMSAYCPQPFFVAGNYKASVDNYCSIINHVIVNEKYVRIRSALDDSRVTGLVHKLHHDESVQRPDVEDAYKVLSECKKAVQQEISRFKVMYNHEFSRLQNMAGTNVVMDTDNLRSNRIKIGFSVIREAAAAHNGEGIEWDMADKYTIEDCQVVQVCSDVIAPVALSGQYLLLDGEGHTPSNGDLVIAETYDNQKYIRRMWREEEGGAVILEGMNPTIPIEPMRIVSAKIKIRRIVGVLYDNSPLPNSNGEWSLRGVKENWFDNIVGVRVNGTSLEPVARDGQIVLIKTQDIKDTISNDMLACLSIKDVGEVIKRCYINQSKCVLCAVNPNDLEIPIVVALKSIQQAYELKGVIFEADAINSID